MKLSVLLVLLGVDGVAAQLQSFDFVARTYHAAGYIDEGNAIGKPDLFGYGLGALEQTTYDPMEKFVYAASERGYVTVIDFAHGPAEAEQVNFTVSVGFALTDVEVCGGYLFIASKDDPNPGMVSIYMTAKRGENGTIVEPKFIQAVEVGVGPDMIYPNPTCDMVGVANEGEGDYDEFLVDPEGSVTLIKGPFNETVEVVQVSLNMWSDEELIEKGVHLPLPLNALEYWDDYSSIADGVDFAEARANYQPASNLEPEYLAWSADGSTLYVNLQENNALVTVDVAAGTATNIFSYGLKNWSMTGIDVVEDGGFTSVIVDGLYTVRSPDSIASIVMEGDTYIVTANEGDDKEYGDYEERVKAGDIFVGSMLNAPNVTADISVFDPMNITSGTSKYFNDECNDTHPATPFCEPSMRVTVGSSMVNYSNPSAPHIYRFVGLGGRGISIYKITGTGLELVWDSADQLEVEGSKAFPWAHNGIQDDEFSPVNGTAYNLADDGLKETIEAVNDPEEDGCEDQGDMTPGACPLGKTVDERSLKDGPAAEAVVVGDACGSKYMATVSEKNSIGFLYKVEDVTSPELVKVFHLSEASETLSPGLAYEAGTLGEVDTESITFLEASKSPTNKAAVLFAGAWSGTLSYWEFNCVDDPPPSPGPTPFILSPKPTAPVLMPTAEVPSDPTPSGAAEAVVSNLFLSVLAVAAVMISQ